MAQTILRLCNYIIRDDFGTNVEQVAKVLLQKGRLPLLLIAKFSKFTLSKTRECLFILIQHNLVYWAETKEGKRIGIYYSIEKDEILARLNFGIYIKNANEWEANEIIKIILLNGKATFQGLIEDMKISKRTNKYKDAKEIFLKMIEKNYITPVSFSDSKSAQDKASEAEQRELAKMTSFIPTKKQMAEVKAKLAADISTDDISTGSQRKGEATGEVTLDENQYYRVNYEKFNVKARNKRFEKFVTAHINKSAGIIMKTILNVADDDKSIPVEKFELLASQIKTERGKSTREALVRQYLDYLIEDETKVLHKKDENLGGMYSIKYQELCESLKREIFEDIILEKYGIMGLRIIRVLNSKQKLDEKSITTFTLMSLSDVRQKLTELLNEGFVQIQEVPRSADRAPSRTYYLWYIDYQRCYEIILNKYYLTLANIHQVRFSQETLAATLLEKKENEEALKQLNNNSYIQLLTENEKKSLNDLEHLLNQLDTSQLRIIQDIIQNLSPDLPSPERKSQPVNMIEKFENFFI
ncbi:1192_t:CDS:10 [Diversispora eburnea]|uniref:DNA-directed RNA polymerase III subunit RPC3 n=1 Tax=Diversispora eburnea TaxID=1213867 RepID=A0A9N9BU12_9GLOM|nr:1192_t:CDS:10 [Diversispora eburnea]